jgi:hypothetical protein
MTEINHFKLFILFSADVTMIEQQLVCRENWLSIIHLYSYRELTVSALDRTFVKPPSRLLPRSSGVAIEAVAGDLECPCPEIMFRIQNRHTHTLRIQDDVP